MARGLHDLLVLTARRARLAAGQAFAMLAKRGDSTAHFRARTGARNLDMTSTLEVA